VRERSSWGIEVTEIEPEIFEDFAPEDQQEDESDLPKDKMGDPSESVLFNTDWTVSTIIQQIERENIKLDPDFQRRSAWDSKRRSHLIESLIIGLPIPNIVLAESKGARGQFMVIDGKQRLSTLYDFISIKSDSSFALRSLTIRDDLNGINYTTLQADFPDDANFLENAPIRTVVIRNWPTEYFLYVIFDRLNSGSLPLSPQELRRALQPGPFLNRLDKYLLDSGAAKKALGLTIPDRRMRDTELVLRYVAFENSYPNYDGDFKEFLDEPVRYFNSEWETRKISLDEILSGLDIALTTSAAIFDPAEIFRKWNGQNFERRMNRAVFDAVTRYFSDPNIAELAQSRRQQIVSELKRLCVEDSDFKRSIEQTTKTPLAVRTRLGTWGKNLGKILDRRFDEATYRLVP
jgi:hypothetical protein